MILAGIISVLFAVLQFFLDVLVFSSVFAAKALKALFPLLGKILLYGVLTIFFSDGILSIPAIIGFISLFGIATRNGMLLIDRYNDLRAGGMSLRDAVSTGSLDRLNPIIMTALTSALALVPLVIGSDLPGNEIQSPMAKVLLGGLISSTLLNGFVIPVVYSLVSSKTEKKDETA